MGSGSEGAEGGEGQEKGEKGSTWIFVHASPEFLVTPLLPAIVRLLLIFAKFSRLVELWL